MRQLATHLAENGIGSLRYDKRGVGASEGDFWTAGLSDNIDDAAAAVACLRSQPGVDPRARLRVRPQRRRDDQHPPRRRARADRRRDPARGRRAPGRGGAAVAGRAGRAGHEGVQQVAHRRPARRRSQAQLKAFAKIKKSTKDSYRVQGIRKINAKWMREFLAYDPAEDLARIEVPVLAITGSKDIQVNPADLDVMAGLVRSEFEPHVVPDLTHLLRADPRPGAVDQQLQGAAEATGGPAGDRAGRPTGWGGRLLGRVAMPWRRASPRSNPTAFAGMFRVSPCRDGRDRRDRRDQARPARGLLLTVAGDRHDGRLGGREHSRRSGCTGTTR